MRTYKIKGVGEFPSVTTVLDIISKPALIQWAANCAIAKVREEAETIELGKRHIIYDDALERCKYAHKDISKEARGTGTNVHKLAEKFALVLKDELNKGGDVYETEVLTDIWEAFVEEQEIERDTPEFRCLFAFATWCQKVRLEPILVEQKVWSTNVKYAGTLDILGLLLPFNNRGKQLSENKVLSVVDLKTNKAFYGTMGRPNEYSMQISAYAEALEEMVDYGIEEVSEAYGLGIVEGAFCVRLDKIEGIVECKNFSEIMSDSFDAFTYLRKFFELYEGDLSKRRKKK